MQLSKSLMLLAALTTSVVARPEGHVRRQGTSTSGASGSSWTSTPSSGSYATSGFGGSTSSSGSGETYSGNVGSPYGSNIIEVSSSDASQYKNVMQFQGSSSDDWTVAIWNKYGEDGKMDGWYGKACKTFTLTAGSTKYIAFDDDTNGGFAAAKGSSIPTSPSSGAYATTWGEFDFASSTNGGCSGFDVSAIQVQGAGMDIQGMKICDALGSTCSSITPNAASVNNAYTVAETDVGGIGGNLQKGPVRLSVELDYSG
ncbi:hypothetical protein N7492_010047 [Penicillium capsulatum]|uniref:Allergen Asp f 4 n=1 Tax=Penicillium capsulatum TaxID=69766 RepID=A0A9W9HNR3_9EURO|nr:hypothetical protein N7492_010047 [Penicillium capsulatum]KAJ6112556.1 hypothetical protein N7512_007880 [Penicillium capsulatum]